MAWVRVEMEVYVADTNNGCPSVKDEEYVRQELENLESSFLYVQVQNIEEIEE